MTSNMLDTKVSWLVVVCSSLSSIIVYGSLVCYAIFFPKILEEFEEGRARTVMVVSLGFSVYSILSPVAAKLCIRFGCRVILMGSGLTSALGLLASSFVPNLYVLYFSYGTVLGFASSMVFNAGFQVVPMYFDKHRSFAVAMISAGYAAGLLVFSPVVQTLMDRLGWRKALLVMAGINLAPIVLGSSITRKSIPTGNEENTQTTPRNAQPSGCCRCLQMLDLSVLRDPIFVIFTVSASIAVMGHYMPYMHLAKYAEDLEIPGNRSSWLYVSIGGSSLITRLLVGKLCDTGWIPLLRIFQGGVIILATINCLLPWAKNLTFLMLYSITFGMGEAMFTTPMYCIMNKSYTGMGFGWYLFIMGIPYLISPTLAGFVADVSGSYHPAFYTAGGILLLSACLPELTRCIKEKNKAEDKYTTREELVIIFEKETVC